MQDSKVFTYKSDEVIEMEKERVKDRERIKKLEMALQVIQDIDRD